MGIRVAEVGLWLGLLGGGPCAMALKGVELQRKP